MLSGPNMDPRFRGDGDDDDDADDDDDERRAGER
jgi:hypothetical protein